MSQEVPDVQAGFKKGRGTRDQIANICWIIKKAREFQKNMFFCFIDYTKAFDCVYHNELWKILKEMGIQDHLTCLLKNLYAGQKATVRTGHGTTNWFQKGKGVCQACILSPCLFNLYAEYIMWNPGLDEAQAGIKIARRNINNRYADGTTLTAESIEELKSLLMKVKEESKKADLKLNIQKTKIMVSGPITSWQTDEETMETVRDFIFWGSKITAGGNCSHEIKMLAPWKKIYDKPRQHVKKQKRLLTNVCLVKGMVFPVVCVWMWELDNKEGWAPKSWCFWTVVLQKTLGLQGGPTSTPYRKSVLNIHWKDWYWSWNSNTLAIWSEELTHRKRPWCWGRLKAGGEGDDRGWDGWMASPTLWIWVWTSSRRWWWTGWPGILQSIGLQRVRHDWATELYWTEPPGKPPSSQNGSLFGNKVL